MERKESILAMVVGLDLDLVPLSKKKCEKLAKGQLQYCFECSDFPCEVLSTLDSRYREKYGFSLVENLRYIQEYGVEEFLKLEKERWKCPVCGGIICVHDKKCYHCKQI